MGQLTPKGSHSPLLPVSYSSPARQWWLVFVVLILSTLGYLDRQMLALMINPIKTDMGLSDTQLSLIVGAAFAISNMAFTLPAGIAADRLSLRMLLGTGAVVWSVATAICGLTSNFVQLLLARAGVGAAEAVIQPSAFSLLRRAVAPERHGRAFSVFYMSNMIGTASALLVGGMLLAALERSDLSGIPLLNEVRPWQAALLLMGVVGLPLTILLTTVAEPVRAQHTTQNSNLGYRAAFAFICRNRRFYAPLWIAQISYMTLAVGAGAWAAAMAGRSYGLSPGEVGKALGLSMLISSPIGLILLGWIVDRMGQSAGLKGVVGVGLLAAVMAWISAVVMPLAPTFQWYIIGMTASFLVSQGPMPTFATVLSSITPPQLIGKITAIQVVLIGLFSMAMGPTIVAALSDNFFSGSRALSHALSLFSLAFGAFAVLGLAALHRQLRRQPIQFNQPLD